MATSPNQPPRSDLVLELQSAEWLSKIPERWITPLGLVWPQGAAIALACSFKTLENWRSLKIGPPYLLVGGRVFYEPSDLFEYSRSRKVNV